MALGQPLPWPQLWVLHPQSRVIQLALQTCWDASIQKCLANTVALNQHGTGTPRATLFPIPIFLALHLQDFEFHGSDSTETQQRSHIFHSFSFHPKPHLSRTLLRWASGYFPIISAKLNRQRNSQASLKWIVPLGCMERDKL